MRKLTLLGLFVALAFKAHCEDPVTILEEHTRMLLAGQKGYVTGVYVEKSTTFQINTAEGVNALSTLSIPEPFDELYRDIAPEIRNVHFYISSLKVEYLEAKSRAPRGGWQTHEPTYEIKEEQYVSPDDLKFHTSKTRVYQFKNLRIGDILEVKYKVSMPMDGNVHTLGSNRLFFHGKYPKEKCTFTLEYDEDLLVSFRYPNGADPHAHIVGKLVQDKWTFSDLAGCMDEGGSRPYLELPHVEYQLSRPIRFAYSRDVIFPVEVPIHYRYALTREGDFIGDGKTLDLGTTVKPYQTLRHYMDSKDPDAGKRLNLNAFVAAHNEIVDEAEYANDLKIFKDEAFLEPSWAEDLSSKKLREIDRYRAYFCMLHYSAPKFFTGYICDNRIGVITPTFLKPVLQHDYIYLASDDEGRLHYVYPKAGTRGYYLDELPFYFEATPVFTVEYYDPEDIHKGLVKDLDKFKGINTPGSATNENIRTVDMKVNVNLAEGTATFEGQTSLNGQYSTMTRGVYIYHDSIDNVHVDYNKPVYAMGNFVETSREEVDITTKTFPFTTRVRFEGSFRPTMHEDSGLLNVHVGEWITHIFTEIDAHRRTLGFYPDFRGMDRWNILVTLDGEVDTITVPENILVQNEYGTYQFSVQLNGSNTVAIMSNYVVNQESVSAEAIENVLSIQSALKSAKAASIVLN